MPCDPLAFAAAIDSSIILAADNIQCRVETQVAEQRGQTSFADQGEGWPDSQCGMVVKVNKVDTVKYAEYIETCLNDEQKSAS